MSDKQEPHGPMRLIIDFGPLVVFFASYRLAGGGLHGTLVATAAFMAAVLIAIGAALLAFRKLTPMVLLSTVLILSFGAITLYLRDPKFIQMKPTFVYAVCAAILGFGLMTGRPLLEQLLGTAYPGLSQLGWHKVTRNWTLFFLGMAVLNELVWRNTSFDFWTAFKLWGAIPMTFVFALANVPMMLKHGLMSEVGDAAVQELPPE